MEKSYMPPESILTFEFLEDREMPMHDHENPEILFVLEGNLRVQTDRQEYRLHNEDFLLINANRAHGYETKQKILAVRFQLSLVKISEILHQNSLMFWCGSVFDNVEKDAVEEMRQGLKNILFYRVHKGANDPFYTRSLDYQLLSLLCSRFLLNEKKVEDGISDEKERLNHIMEYIRLNYRKPISLKDVADELYLSPTYLSKYIHKSSGMGFVDLISSVRLNHAVGDLLYTDHTVTRVALDNGFASAAALNKTFKDIYGTTPSEYRKKLKNARPENDSHLEEAAAYLRSHMEEIPEKKHPVQNELTISQTECTFRPIRLNNILNAGCAADLLDASAQKQILYLRDSLGIRYVRFWNLLDPKMNLRRKNGQIKLNFDRLDEILDFLTAENLYPYIELRSKQVRILKNVDEICEDRIPPEDFENDEERVSFFDALFGHLIRRYGRTIVSDWLFDYAMSGDTRFENQAFVFVPKTEREIRRYFRKFNQIYVSLKKRFPSAKIGGAGFPVHHYGEEELKEIFNLWADESRRPDFISFTSFPYQILKIGDNWYEKRRTNYDFAEEDTELVEKAMQKSRLGVLPLHLQECNLTLSDRSYANDTVMRAAFFANVITKLYDRIDYFGIWNMRDAYSEAPDSSAFLFGGSGILTKTGTPKPAFYTLNFLHRLYLYSVTPGQNCLISGNEHRHFKILLYHLVDMNTAYYVKKEDQLSPMGIEQMTESKDSAVYHIRLENLPEGCWQIRKYCLSRNEGSILNEWLNLNEELLREEAKYIQRICVPRLYIERQNTKDGVLEFDTELEPNEVQYLHITEYN